ncbi:hypothetical protein F5B20DRAFT_514653 [Whalleya microplaca]|nr:hypothetical protein F5B20DRAFT_514653 [Whalleya microplaca]
MSFGPQVFMPGAFHFEAPNGGASLSGVNPGIFRPPISPSASSSVYLGRSTGSLNSDASTPAPNVKRKRHAPFNDWSMMSDAGSSARGSGASRRISGGESRYVLAGRIETPTGGAAQRNMGNMEDSVYSDVDYRHTLGPTHTRDSLQSPNDSPQIRPQAPQTSGWNFFAMSAIGGVVGKVWEFCKAGAFRGFYAGGGKGYEMDAAAKQGSSQSQGHVWCNEHDIPTLPDDSYSSVPGGFPQSDYSPFYYEQETPESTPPRPAKRRQLMSDAAPSDEIRRNWVMVNDPTDSRRRPSISSSSASRAPTRHVSNPKPATPVSRRINKPISRLNTTPGLNRRPSSRVSHAGSVSLSNREPASFASPRPSSVVPHASAASAPSSRLPVPSRPQTPVNRSPTRLSQQPSRIPSPSPTPYSKQSSHRRTHSSASGASAASGKMRSRASVHEFEESSPRLDAEAKNLAAKRLRAEREADLRINDFNARLQDMIRQGKEALGTKVDVEIDGDDGGMDTWEDE